MKEYPIIFNTEMVKAILKGRKTTTRRVIKPQPHLLWDTHHIKKVFRPEPKCPYGKVGDRLWVRESYCCNKYLQKTPFIFKADYKQRPTWVKQWGSSLYMPKSISRITLEIMDVKVEKLQEISNKEALKEGLPIRWWLPLGDNPIECFKSLWNSIHKKQHRWQDNPWVWVISFKKIK